MTKDQATNAAAEEIPTEKARLRHAVRFFYDAQKLRQQAMQRYSSKTAALDERDKAFAKKTAEALKGLEGETLKEVKRLLKPFPIAEWLLEQRGVGPTMAGVLCAHINIENCHTPSHLWAFTGLAVRNGKADRRVKGQKARYDPWLKSKMVKVLADCLIKSNSEWRKFYDDYKHRKKNQQVDTCMLCEGTGRLEPTSLSHPKASASPKDATKGKDNGKKPKKVPCNNCEGTGGPAPWGRSDAHRDAAARRYMVKMLLAEMWRQWRQLEGYDIRPPYAEEYLGITHHSS